MKFCFYCSRFIDWKDEISRQMEFSIMATCPSDLKHADFSPQQGFWAEFFSFLLLFLLACMGAEKFPLPLLATSRCSRSWAVLSCYEAEDASSSRAETFLLNFCEPCSCSKSLLLNGCHWRKGGEGRGTRQSGLKAAKWENKKQKLNLCLSIFSCLSEKKQKEETLFIHLTIKWYPFPCLFFFSGNSGERTQYYIRAESMKERTLAMRGKKSVWVV